MWRTTWKGLLGHKLRLLLTALAIVLGTSFVAGSYIFTDTLGGLFEDLFADAFAGTDVLVQAVTEEELGGFVLPDRFDPGLVDEVRAIEGVAEAEGTIAGIANLADAEGELLGGAGPPTLVSAWIDVGNPFELREGRPPETDDELVMDKASADRFGLSVGDGVQLFALGRPEPFTVVGLIGLGSSDGFGGATAVGLDFAAADRLFAAEGMIDTINVVGVEGQDPDVLASRINAVLPEGVAAINSSLAAEEQLEGFREALDFINTFLLVFGLVALFAGTFLIQNTFQIIVTQRTRELAMLRAIGATRGQILRMVLTEAATVAIVASSVGVVAGIGLASAIRFGFERFGGDIPSSALIVAPRTIGVALVTGLVVTLASAILPAVKASRIPPVAAMREALALPKARSLRRRGATGALVSVVGLLVLFLGLTGNVPEAVSRAAAVGAGGGVLFIGIAILTPLFARPVGRGLGTPAAATGAIGRLAQENAVRSPRRTAATSSSIMIGTALAGLALILGASLSVTTDQLIEDTFRSEFIVQPAGFGGSELSQTVAPELEALEEVEAVAAIRRNAAVVEDDRSFIAAADLARLTELITFDAVEGDLTGLTDAQVAISQELSDESGLGVGDAIDVAFQRTGDQTFEVGAVYSATGAFSDLYLTLGAWDQHFTERFDSAVYVELADGVTLEEGRAAIETVTSAYPGAEALDQNQFAEEAKTQIRQFVGLVFALLALTLLIGFVGILNTLLLSIIERTREIGLLRAVGTTRRQLAGMITWEAVIVAVFGALLGVAMGIFFGWAIVTSLQDDSELILSIPEMWLLTAVAVAALAGVVASVYPAWRASRLNVLAAIAYE